MKKHLPALSVSFLLLLPSGLHAQQSGGWFHPELSASSFLTGSYVPETEEGKVSALSALSATFGRGTALEASLSFDVVQKKLMGYELAWHPVPALRVRAGIQRMPFLMETTYSPRTLEAVGYSQSASYLGGYSRDLTGVNSRSRDCGVFIEGMFCPKDGFNVLNIVAGLFIGNGYSFKDDNRAKDFQGRVVLQPDRRWKFSAGTMIGRYGGEALVRNRFTAGFWYDDGRWFARGENIYRRAAKRRILRNGRLLVPADNGAFSAHRPLPDRPVRLRYGHDPCPGLLLPHTERRPELQLPPPVWSYVPFRPVGGREQHPFVLPDLPLRRQALTFRKEKPRPLEGTAAIQYHLTN